MTSEAITVDGRQLRFTHPERVVYPSTGLTKQGVLEYYLAVAPALIPLANHRAVTRKRWLAGVGTPDAPGDVFFHKDIDKDAPEWIRTHKLEHADHTNHYPIIDSPAVLAFYVQHGTLEFHVPQWTFGPRGALHKPDRIVLDLDPGPGAGLEECVEVALILRERLHADKIDTIPVTSGSKGIHLYGRLDGTLTSDEVTERAHALADALHDERPDLVVSNIRKAQREGKVLLDWSQNRAGKTTVTPYSLRGRARPWVALPRTWEELTAPGLYQAEYGEVAPLLATRGCPLLALMRANEK